MRRLSLWLPVALYMAAIFALSAKSDFDDFGPRIIWNLVFDFDKVAHAIEYGMLAALLLRATRAAPLSLLIACLYGVSDEVHQFFVPGRAASPFDALADFTGAGIVCALYYWRTRNEESIGGRSDRSSARAGP